MRVTTATYITLLRLFLILPILLALQYDLLILALVLLLIALFSDYVDGVLARKTQTVTVLGSFLDHLADKLLVHIVLLYFVVVHGLSAIAFGIFLARDFFVLGIRHLAAHKQEEISSMSLGKLKFFGQSILLIVLVVDLLVQQVSLQTVTTVFLWATVVLAVVSAGQIAKKGWFVLRD